MPALQAGVVVGVLSPAAGDNVAYWLGRVYGRRVVVRNGHWALITPERLARMEQFIRRYGGLGVIVARFLPGLRFLGGPVAGVVWLPIG